MKSYEEIYREWRWLIYNRLDVSTLNLMIEGILSINLGNKTYSDNPNFRLYTDDKIIKYKKKDFFVSKEQIETYDNDIIKYAKEWTEKYSSYYFASNYFLRSKFIENCYINTNDFKKNELINEIKKNIIYYQWWDILNFDELMSCILENHFLSSTCKLVSKNTLKEYIKDKFKEKDNFINHILSHFEPRNSMIEEMNVTSRFGVVFDYNWLFSNDLKKSIRILENECRMDHNEKIIGSFYNEDILFREIKRKFGEKLRVISQGSPEWLGNQRFDIYFPDLNIAVEYQGEQHQRPVDFGGKGKKIALQQFKENIKRDNLKKEKAENNGCVLLYAYPNYDIKVVMNNLKLEIQNRINHNQKASQ